MISKRFPIMLALAICGLLSGCVSTLSEDTLFYIQPLDVPGRTDLSIENEDVFSTPQAFTLMVDINGEKVTKSVEEDGFVPASVMHGKQRGIAFTHIYREEPGRPLALHCGGNAATRYRSGVGYALKILPYADVLIFDYPGMGDSEGKATVANLDDITATIAAIVDERSDGSRSILLWGHSLGGFICSIFAQRGVPADAIILETTAQNAQALVDGFTPWYAKPFVHVKVAENLKAFDIVTLLEEKKGTPILVLAGGKDRVIPTGIVRKLAQGLEDAGHQVTYQNFKAANHVSVGAADGFDAVMSNFLSSLANEPLH